MTPITRRSVLAAIAAGTAAGVVGCGPDTPGANPARPVLTG